MDAPNDGWDDISDQLFLGIQYGSDQQVEENKKVNKVSQNHENSNQDSLDPLHKFRGGYLWVSDLIRQNWCEQQMLYSFTVPGVVEENPVMTAGTDIHLERELEVHSVVQVKTESREDIFGIKVLNLLDSVCQLLHGSSVCREIPVFGMPFGEEILIIGIIDEIKCNTETMVMDLLEFKTRGTKSLPSAAQKKTHDLQVMLYKKIFDDLVKGNFTKEMITKKIKLDLEKEFGSDLQSHIDTKGHDCKTLDQLLDYTFHRLQCITLIKNLKIEYCFQIDKSTIAVEDVEYDEEWLKSIFKDSVRFWKGQREVCGVDIEEAWKCQRCDYADVCEWRDKKAKELSEKNQKVSNKKL